MKKKIDEFGPVLRQLRVSKDLTQEELSEMVNVHSGYISRLESGQKYPNLDMIFKLAEALGMRSGDMLDAIENRWKGNG